MQSSYDIVSRIVTLSNKRIPDGLKARQEDNLHCYSIQIVSSL